MSSTLTSRRISSRIGSASSITLPAQETNEGRRADYVGMSLFWGVVLLVVVATLLLYCWPAAQRIGEYRAALDEAEAELNETQALHTALELEQEALDDPFTIEWILRRDHNWQPTD